MSTVCRPADKRFSYGKLRSICRFIYLFIRKFTISRTIKSLYNVFGTMGVRGLEVMITIEINRHKTVILKD